MQCPWCVSGKTRKNGQQSLKDGTKVQCYSCRGCYRNFNKRAGTPMYRLKTPARIVEYALKGRTEDTGLGLQATGRIYDKSHSTIMRWEKRIARQEEQWSPPVEEGKEVTVEGDEIYTRVGENLPPSESQGWTINFLERDCRYWIMSKEVHVNHNEANNAAIRRRCSAYRRRHNHYAKRRKGLQRSIDVQRLVHNWCRPHASLGKNATPVMAMGLARRPISIFEMLHSLSYKELLS